MRNKKPLILKLILRLLKEEKQFIYLKNRLNTDQIIQMMNVQSYKLMAFSTFQMLGNSIRKQINNVPNAKVIRLDTIQDISIKLNILLINLIKTDLQRLLEEKNVLQDYIAYYNMPYKLSFNDIITLNKKNNIPVFLLIAHYIYNQQLINNDKWMQINYKFLHLLQKKLIYT